MNKRHLIAIGLMQITATNIEANGGCDSVLIHAARNVESSFGSEHVVANKHQKNCGKDFSLLTESQTYELEVEIFGSGAGGGGASLNKRQEALREWCTTNQQTYEKNKTQLSSSSLVYAESVKAWLACKSSTTEFNIDISKNEKYVAFLLRRGDGAIEQLKSLRAEKFNCKKGSVDLGLSPLNANDFNNDISADGMPIHCTRTEPVEVVFEGEKLDLYEFGYIHIATTGTTISLNFEEMTEPKLSRNEKRHIDEKIETLNNKFKEFSDSTSAKLTKLEIAASAAQKTADNASNVASSLAPAVATFISPTTDCPSGWQNIAQIGFLIWDHGYQRYGSPPGTAHGGKWGWTHPFICKKN
ncbi:MAG: hypothetical protein Q8Q80_19080 [Methyloversatilis sp.]|uniref:hypothetical protein n=1 Tax=Methyloversatilis sp. TaxID=2569862 RepID=UPI00273455DF|nr:hypothetical protein [Methyloversatilis sp.]MDP3874770.1 hypothetical protein [Methyloversatilis sp.]